MTRAQLFLIGLLCTMLLLIPGVSGCGADSDAQTAAREMLQASEDGDCEKAAGYIDLEETMRELGVEISMDDLVEACEAEKEESPLVDFEITGETEVEDGVEVSVELVNEVNGEEVTSEDTIMMKEIGGEWKIIP